MLPHRFSVPQSDGFRPGRGVQRSQARIFRNDWRALDPPGPGEWEPALGVSVVVSALPGDRADLTLAALSVQTYPAALLDVVVVAADGAEPPARPPGAPWRMRAERLPSGAGLREARALGARASAGEVICWLDAGTLVDPYFTEMHARWHHLHSECVTIADVLVTGDGPADASDAVDLALSGTMVDVLGARGACPERDALLEATGDLSGADESGHRTYTSAAAALRRPLYEAVKGAECTSDADLGHRLWQAGGVFVPDRDAPAWRLGGVLREDTAADRATDPEAPGGRPPRVRAVIDIEDAPYDMVRGCVDRLLDGTEQDIDVVLVADWDRPGHDDAGSLELRLLQARYLSEPRVSYAVQAPRTGFPAPFLLQLPVAWGLNPDSLELLADRADRARAGVVELVPEEPPAHGAGVRLWRTRALLRAMRVRERGQPLSDVVAEVYGRYRIQCGPGALIDLADREAPPYRSVSLRTGARGRQCPRPPDPAPEPEPEPVPAPGPPDAAGHDTTAVPEAPDDPGPRAASPEPGGPGARGTEEDGCLRRLGHRRPVRAVRALCAAALSAAHTARAAVLRRCGAGGPSTGLVQSDLSEPCAPGFRMDG